MSTVKGFNTTLGVLKYDAESLDNYNTPLFDSTSTYEVGDYVIEDGKLYRCITDVPTAGSWSSVSSNFVAAILTDDIKGIKEDVDDLSTNFSTLEGNVGTLEDNVQTLSSDVGTLSTDVNNLTTSVGKINNSIALTFNTSTSYAIGDYVLYGGSLYRFTAAHAAGAWIGTDATQVQLAEETIFVQGGGTNGSAVMRDWGNNPCIASGDRSFAGGVTSIASGDGAFAYGQKTNGISTTAAGSGSLAIGKGVTANGNASQAFGQETVAKAAASTALGNFTISSGLAATVIGQANVEDTEDVSGHGNGAKKHIFIIGNGLNASNRSNALAVDWDGNEELAGNLTLNKGATNEFTINGDVIKASIPHDTASGSIASFPDGAAMPVIDCSVAVAPNQDLHGYDNPWPAGGGKNLLPTITSVTTLNGVTWTPNADGTIKVNGTASANSVIDLGRNVLTLPAGTYTTNQSVANQFDVNVFRLVNGSGVLHAQGGGTFTLTEESSIFVRFAVLTGVTVNNVIIQPMLESGSEMTSFAPYSNICPISGWTGAKVTRTGKNLLKALYSGRTNNGVTYAIDADGVISLSGIANGSSYAAPNLSGDTSQMMYLKAGTYTLSGGISSAIRLYFGGKYIDGTGLSGIGYDTGNGLTYTFSKDVWLYPQIVVSSGTDTTGKSVKPMLVLGNTATAYEPYQGQTYTIDLNGTRYGGTLDVTNGKMYVEKVSLDLGTLSFTRVSYNGYYRFYSGSISNIKTPTSNSSVGDIICEIYKTDKVDAYGQNNTIGIATNGRIFIYDNSYTTASALETALDGVTAVYSLVSPIEIDLTPNTAISTLYGTNNIWADAGNIIVNYYADTTLFINKKIAAAIAALS